MTAACSPNPLSTFLSLACQLSHGLPTHAFFKSRIIAWNYTLRLWDPILSLTIKLKDLISVIPRISFQHKFLWRSMYPITSLTIASMRILFPLIQVYTIHSKISCIATQKQSREILEVIYWSLTEKKVTLHKEKNTRLMCQQGRKYLCLGKCGMRKSY